jgi:hypothetical protein
VAGPDDTLLGAVADALVPGAASQFVVGPLQEVPAAASRVTLERSVADRNGVPAVRLVAESPRAERRARGWFLSRRAAEWLEASGPS